MTPLARYLSIWLREHLPVDRGVSPNTVDAYSQSLAALLRFAADRLGRPPSELAFEDIDAPLILAFLEEIERRGASVRTRNARLAAIKALFRFLEYRLPAALEQIRQVQAIPRKKADEALVAWLTRAEIGALLAEKRVTPHVLRHSCAMHTLQATGDVRKVSLWLGHASIQSTEIYLRADPMEKLEMIAGMTMPKLKPGRFRPPDKLLAMLAGKNSL